MSCLPDRLNNSLIVTSRRPALGPLEDVPISVHTIRGTLRPSTGDKAPPLRFMTVRVDDPDLVQELEAHRVKYAGRYDSDVLKTLLSWIVPLGFLFMLWGFLSRRLGPGQGVMNFGKSRARIYAGRETGVTFADVAGVDERRRKNSKRLLTFCGIPEVCHPWWTYSKGLLWVGPTGTGKNSPGTGGGGRGVSPVL